MRCPIIIDENSQIRSNYLLSDAGNEYFRSKGGGFTDHTNMAQCIRKIARNSLIFNIGGSLTYDTVFCLSCRRKVVCRVSNRPVLEAHLEMLRAMYLIDKGVIKPSQCP